MEDLVRVTHERDELREKVTDLEYRVKNFRGLLDEALLIIIRHREVLGAAEQDLKTHENMLLKHRNHLEKDFLTARITWIN